MRILFDPDSTDGGQMPSSLPAAPAPEPVVAPTADLTPVRESLPGAADAMAELKGDSTLKPSVDDTSGESMDDLFSKFEAKKAGLDPLPVEKPTPSDEKPVVEKLEQVDEPLDIEEAFKLKVDDSGKLVEPAKAEPQDDKPQLTNVDIFKQRFVDAKKVPRDVEEFVNSRLKRLDAAEQETKKTKAELVELQTKAVDGAETFWNHPEGYTLSEEYRATQSLAHTASFEVKYWRKQLEAVENGQPAKVIEWDNAKQRYVETVELEPNGKTKVDILTHLQLLAGRQQQAEQALHTIKSNHGVQSKKVTEYVQGVQQKFFGDYSNLPANHALTKVRDSFDASIPSTLKANPLYPVVQSMALKIHEYGQHIKKLNQGQSVQRVLKDERVLLSPKQDELGAQKGQKPKINIDSPEYDLMGEFDRVKRGY